MPSETPAWSSPTWKALSARPRIESLRRFVQRLLEREGTRISFIVLYGSMARGDWSRASDFDVLVGTATENAGRVIDRIQQFDVYSDGWVEPLSYGPREVEQMFCSFNLVILAALRDGVVLHDDGRWGGYQERYRRLIDDGDLVREERGWRWTEDARHRVQSVAG